MALFGVEPRSCGCKQKTAYEMRISDWSSDVFSSDLLSGVHATIAGVAAALVIPITPSPGAPDDAASPLHRLEHALHPWVAFAIVPLFGFANAGVDLSGMGLETLLAPLPLGIAAGLVVVKQLGIFGAVGGTVKLGRASGRERG